MKLKDLIVELQEIASDPDFGPDIEMYHDYGGIILPLSDHPACVHTDNRRKPKVVIG